MSLGKLQRPPIVEVICGFVFEPLPLDPLLVGTYWQQRRDEYPGREIHPPVVDTPFAFLSGPSIQVRSWLVSGCDAFLLQIQPDRFYFNWRKRAGEYPRFSDRDGAPTGVLSRALEEFDRFAAFCEVATGKRPAATHIELAKIDHLVEGSHYDDANDLIRMLPLLESFLAFRKTAHPRIALRFDEQRDRGRLLVSLESAESRQDPDAPVVLLKLETRLANIEVGDARDAFKWANGELNGVFAALIPEAERAQRFNTAAS